MQIRATARRWGSSLAVIIPSEVAKSSHIKENDTLMVDIKKPVLGKEVFGLLRDWKVDPQKIKDGMRKGWESDSDRRRWKK